MKRVEPKPCKAFKIDKVKFEANSHLILDVFLVAFLLKIVFIATSYLSGVIVNTHFPVMDEDSGVQAKFQFVYQNCVKLIGHGGAHKHSCVLKSLFIQNTSSISSFLPTSLTTRYEVKN